MTAPELVAFIRQQSQAGVSAQQLRETLMEAGWRERDVENALHDVAAGLQPVTTGASIHEDLAQVRGLVAHLTSRVKRLEARLVNAGSESMLTEPEELPSGAMERARALPSPRITRWSIAVRLLVVVLVCAGAGFYLASVTPETALSSLTATGAIAAVLAIGAWFFIRSKRVWPAQISAAMAAALGVWSAWLAWNTYQLLEWTTVLAIGVLLLVYLFVVGRWIQRIERR